MAKGKQVIVEIHGAERVGMSEDGIRAVIQRYGRLKRNLTVRFKVLGWSRFGHVECGHKGHDMVIDPRSCSYRTKWLSRTVDEHDSTARMVKLKHSDTEALVMVTLIHELRHCQQYEKDPHAFNRGLSMHSCGVAGLSFMKNHWSHVEIDARTYEDRHTVNALALYREYV